MTYRIFLALAGLSLLACGGGTAPVAPTPPTPVATPVAPVATPVAPVATADSAPTSSLPYPWSALALPLGMGEVIEVSGELLLVAYDAQDLRALTNAYMGALTAQGFVQKEDVSFPGVTALVYEKTGQFYGLATGTEDGANFVYMEDLGKIGTRSSIRGKKAPGVKGRRKGGGGGPRGNGPRGN